MTSQSKIENRKSEIIVLPDRSALARQAATRFVALARLSIHAHGRFAVVVSGGSTPRDLYALMATPAFAAQIDWARVHFFWGDERAVPPDNAESNYRMTNDVLLAHVPVPPQNVHRIHAELQPQDAAQEYENELRRFFQPKSVQALRTQGQLAEDEVVDFPEFDLILLGLGANGHTASLFPHTRVVHETERWVASEYIDEVNMWRITLTAPSINAAANILWLVAGADKATTVREVLCGDYRPDDLPAQLIQPTHGQVVWLLDKGASEKLEAKS